MQNAQDEEWLGSARGKFGERLEGIEVGIRGVRRSVLQQFPKLVEDEEEPADLIRRACSFEGFSEQLGNRVSARLLPRCCLGKRLVDAPHHMGTASAVQVSHGDLQSTENRELQRFARPGDYDGQERWCCLPRRPDMLSEIRITGTEKFPGRGVAGNERHWPGAWQ